MIRDVSMVRFSHIVRYTNHIKRAYIHISGRTISVKYGVCYLLIDLDAPLIGFLVRLMWIISAGLDVVLAHDL